MQREEKPSLKVERERSRETDVQDCCFYLYRGGIVLHDTSRGKIII